MSNSLEPHGLWPLAPLTMGFLQKYWSGLLLLLRGTVKILILSIMGNMMLVENVR